MIVQNTNNTLKYVVDQYTQRAHEKTQEAVKYQKAVSRNGNSCAVFQGTIQS